MLAGVARQETSATPTTRDLPESAEQDFAIPSRAETFDESAFVDSFAKPARTETFDESAFVDSFADPKRADTFDEAALVDSLRQHRNVPKRSVRATLAVRELEL